MSTLLTKSPRRCNSVLAVTAAIGVCALTLQSSAAVAAVYYVDGTNGNDSNSGLTVSEAFETIARVNAQTLSPGDAVLFRRGDSFPETLELDSDGTESNRILVSAWGSGDRPLVYGVNLRSTYITIDDIDIDHRKDDSDAVRLRDAKNCILRNMEIRNGTRDAIDVNGSDSLLVEDVEIHHFLNGSYGSKDDAHGLAITDTRGVTIRRANIHHVSGDSVQTDPNRVNGSISDDILIEDSHLWTSPLANDFNSGWVAGNSPGENALDTKVVRTGFETEIRMRISLRNIVSHGWTAESELPRRAAFNLKEKIDANLDRITVYDSEVAFRVRGGFGNANTSIMNAVVYSVDTAVRAEDDVADLRIFNSTFGRDIGTKLEVVNGTSAQGSWDIRNNAFLQSKPQQASQVTNIVATESDFVSPEARDYRLTAGASVINTGETIPEVVADRDGQTRIAPYDSGAYEFQSNLLKPMPPVLEAQ